MTRMTCDGHGSGFCWMVVLSMATARVRASFQPSDSTRRIASLTLTFMSAELGPTRYEKRNLSQPVIAAPEPKSHQVPRCRFARRDPEPKIQWNIYHMQAKNRYPFAGESK